LILAVIVTITSGFCPAFVLYLLAVIAIFTHFFNGPLRLIQDPMEQGNVEEVEKI
jgi:hypothetical protein